MKYIHLRRIQKTLLSTGGVTIAYNSIKKGSYTEHTISFAVCSEKDNYCKRTGRDKALDRFVKGHTYKLESTSNQPIYEILQGIEEFFDNNIYLDYLDKKTMKILKKECHGL